MLVRDLGDAYGIVLQPDHGELAGGLAAAWRRDGGLAPALWDALTVAAARHDDGWAVWERHPRIDPDGRPMAFFATPVGSLLASYRAAVEVLAAEDELAGLLVSRHVSGLQRSRYGSMGGQTRPLEDLDPEVRDFVTREEDRQRTLVAAHDVDPAELDRAYALLQVLDVLSLHFGLTPDEPRTIEVPGLDERFELTPDGSAIRVTPYPFASQPVELTLRSRRMPGRTWRDDAAFRADFHRAPSTDAALRLIDAGAR